MKKRFEYKIFNMPVKKWYGTVDNEEMIKQLNKEGMDGWEIAESSIGQSLGAFSLILKREI